MVTQSLQLSEHPSLQVKVLQGWFGRILGRGGGAPGSEISPLRKVAQGTLASSTT